MPGSASAPEVASRPRLLRQVAIYQIVHTSPQVGSYTVTVRAGRCREFVQALLEGNRYFIKQVDAVRLQSPASNSVVPEMRYSPALLIFFMNSSQTTGTV